MFPFCSYDLEPYFAAKTNATRRMGSIQLRHGLSRPDTSLGPPFHAQITGGGNQYFTTFNSKALQVQANLLNAQAAVEEEIINIVRTLLPAYRVIFERVQKRGLITTHATVTSTKGKEE